MPKPESYQFTTDEKVQWLVDNCNDTELEAIRKNVGDVVMDEINSEPMNPGLYTRATNVIEKEFEERFYKEVAA
jgi:hypothetical protein